jgi:2',3'-cyclic-nucleotide 2'-phosphodiesterase (5'-nucleotidase family)
MSVLTIIHTNDTHGRLIAERGGAAAVRGRLSSLLAEHPSALYLDAGDTVTAGNLGFRLGGEPVLELLSELGCTAMCLGNRETHPRKECFPLKINRARHPILCANISAKNGAPCPTVPHVWLERDGLRIGVFGVTTPMFTRKQWSQPLCDYWFADPLEAAAEQAALLRPEVDVLIALTHIGHRQDLALAKACPELDCIIGGHSHTDLDAPAWVGDVPVLQAWAYGYYAGIARFDVEGGRGRLSGWEKRALRDDLPTTGTGGT